MLRKRYRLSTLNTAHVKKRVKCSVAGSRRVRGEDVAGKGAGLQARPDVVPGLDNWVKDFDFIFVF